MRNIYDPKWREKHSQKSPTVQLDSPDTKYPRERGRYDPLPGVDVPYFIRPVKISGRYLLSFEDAFRILIATEDTTILVPEHASDFMPGWYVHVIKRTPPVGHKVKFEPETNAVNLYSIENSREILETNGLATLLMTDTDEWQIIGGLA